MQGQTAQIDIYAMLLQHQLYQAAAAACFMGQFAGGWDRIAFLLRTVNRCCHSSKPLHHALASETLSDLNLLA